jgi:guanine deaminase
MSSSARVVRGPVLNPQPDGTVGYLPDGALVADSAGTILWVGLANEKPIEFAASRITRAAGVLTPPFLDLHTHIPQHPIRGRFTEGISGEPPEGWLLAGLNRNVFPEEGRDADVDYAAQVVRAFRSDTLSHGVVGGAAYMTVHTGAARAALAALPDTWHVGHVLMDQNCPPYLRTDADTLERDTAALAEAFGKRLIVTDRFAVACSTPLRRKASHLARTFGLRTQTHLNEQRAEKALVERTLYPPTDGYASYTDVYRRDGLLDAPGAILAHCIQMRAEEWVIAADAGAVVAHCPTSNALLGSGVMPLDALPASVPYALCTDVGASLTCSLLQEMAQFLKVHAGRSARATPEEALFRVTLAPAQILGMDDRIGSFAPGKPLSYLEIALPDGDTVPRNAAEAILAVLEMPSEALSSAPAATRDALDRLATDGLPHGGPYLRRLEKDVTATADRVERKVLRVVLDGKVVWERSSPR